MSDSEVPFNRPHLIGTETSYIEEAVASGWISAGGSFSSRCQEWLAGRYGAARALLTHSCTAALEASSMLAGLEPGDEVIVPSFTFVSTANAYAMRGATPVFVDIRSDTLNLDENLVAAAITARTKAIIPVHYAGVGAEMDSICAIAAEHGLSVIEDAAQGIESSYRGRALGSIGQLGTLSFHETKNVTCGEGGALLVNDPALVERAEVLWDKGTNRARFYRGQVDRYTWVDLGSSYGMGEVTAAFLWGQLEAAEATTARRVAIWNRYHEAFAEAEASGFVRRPIIPSECSNNGHMYYLLMPGLDQRTQFIDALKARGIFAVFHYVPLHSSPFGGRVGRAHGSQANGERVSEQLVRLPMWAAMTDDDVDRVIWAGLQALGLQDAKAAMA